ncbi:MAG: DUF3299 domain-containing protein [Oligoflexales bacterium]
MRSFRDANVSTTVLMGLGFSIMELCSSRWNIYNSAFSSDCIYFPTISFLSPQYQLNLKKKSSQIKLSPEPDQNNIVMAVGWALLQTMDYQKSEIPSELQEAVNKRIRIPGFGVPLSDGFNNIKEFLLVPNQMACIHVPAAPPNLVVLVELETGVSISELTGPLWIEGVLEVKKSESVYGAAAYEMKAFSVKPYSVPS